MGIWLLVIYARSARYWKITIWNFTRKRVNILHGTRSSCGVEVIVRMIDGDK
jgi:hypothetical protein